MLFIIIYQYLIVQFSYELTKIVLERVVILVIMLNFISRFLVNWCGAVVSGILFSVLNYLLHFIKENES